MLVWDISTSRCVLRHRFKAHPGAVTSVEVFPMGPGTFASCAVDGMLKLWDPRQSGSGLILKTSPHAVTTAVPSKSLGPRGTKIEATNPIKSPAISTMAMVYSKGSADVTYIVTGAGAGDGPNGAGGSSSVVLTDIRQSSRPVAKLDQAKNGIYSMCVVGDECLLVGDGKGYY